MRQPRADDRGILDPARLRRRVRFRRHLPAVALRHWVEHYWLIDWDLTEPFEQRIVPHPAVNVVFQRDGDGPERAEVAGVGTELFSITLTGSGRVSGVQFRPGGFHPFWRRSVAELTAATSARRPGRPRRDPGLCRHGRRTRPGAGHPADRLGTPTDPVNDEVMRLVETIRTDRNVRRVDEFAREHAVSVRRLQRLFLTHVGVGPKW